jgi:hypothetical protein
LTHDNDFERIKEAATYVIEVVTSTAGNGSGLVAAPEEILFALFVEIKKELGGLIGKEKKTPHRFLEFNNGFRLYFKPIGYDGNALRGILVRTFGIIFCLPNQETILKEFYRSTSLTSERKQYDL